MRGVTEQAFGGFHDRFRECGVRVDALGEILGARSHLDRDDGFTNQFPGIDAHNPHAQELLRLGLGDQLGDAFRSAQRSGTAGSRPRKTGKR